MAKVAGEQGKLGPVAALLILCLLWALDGLAPDLFPVLRRAPMPAMERQAITYALFAVVAFLLAMLQKARVPGFRRVVMWAAVGMLAFGAPVLLGVAAQGWVPQLERVAIFSLAPVFAVVLEPHITGTPVRSNSALLAALVAIGGTLCIFPLSIPANTAAALAALVVVVAAVCAAVGNCLAVQLACKQREGSLAFVAVIAGGAVAVAFAVTGLATEDWQLPQSTMQLARIVMIDLPTLLLLFWLLRRMSAVRMTTRYLLAPWLTVLAGLALEQPAITVRIAVGVVLIGAGAAWLLLAPEGDAESNTSGIL
jgi:drug/metabolite transporter (DMT)-like permease